MLKIEVVGGAVELGEGMAAEAVEGAKSLVEEVDVLDDTWAEVLEDGMPIFANFLQYLDVCDQLDRPVRVKETVEVQVQEEVVEEARDPNENSCVPLQRELTARCFGHCKEPLASSTVAASDDVDLAASLHRLEVLARIPRSYVHCAHNWSKLACPRRTSSSAYGRYGNQSSYDC